MAIWNEILEGGLNQALAKRLGMQTASPSPSVSPEIMAGLTLENDRPEWGYLKGEVLGSARAAQVAVAAQFSFGALSNPTGSNLIVVIEKIEVQCPAGSAAIFRVRPVGSVAGTPVTPQVRDTRWIIGTGAARTAANMSVGTAAGLGLEAPFAWAEVGSRYEYNRPVILRPGSSCVIELGTANVGCNNFAFHWRERGALPGELGL